MAGANQVAAGTHIRQRHSEPRDKQRLGRLDTLKDCVGEEQVKQMSRLHAKQLAGAYPGCAGVGGGS